MLVLPWVRPHFCLISASRQYFLNCETRASGITGMTSNRTKTWKNIPYLTTQISSIRMQGKMKHIFRKRVSKSLHLKTTYEPIWLRKFLFCLWGSLTHRQPLAGNLIYRCSLSRKEDIFLMLEFKIIEELKPHPEIIELITQERLTIKSQYLN